MKEELVAGLRNALDRGESIDLATQSFINAGYNSQDVSEAANFLTQGALNVVISSAKSPVKVTPNPPIQKQETKVISYPSQPLTSKTDSSPQMFSSTSSILESSSFSPPLRQTNDPYLVMQSVSGKNNLTVKRKRMGLIIFLVVALIIILFGIVAALLMKEQISSILNNLLT